MLSNDKGKAQATCTCQMNTQNLRKLKQIILVICVSSILSTYECPYVVGFVIFMCVLAAVTVQFPIHPNFPQVYY